MRLVFFHCYFLFLLLYLRLWAPVSLGFSQWAPRMKLEVMYRESSVVQLTAPERSALCLQGSSNRCLMNVDWADYGAFNPSVEFSIIDL
ncbi:hypothetical protein V8F33_003532 [Rhypophila sp. PSN 637]